MGIFGFVKELIQEAGEETNNAQQQAENWDVLRICDKIQNTESMAKCAGYIRVLKEKSCDLENYELIDAFEFAISRKNIKACNAMLPEMDSRGLAYKNSEGKLIKNY